jgi:hypothetical protein
MFVELDVEHVEGLVPSDALGNRSRFDEKLHALVLGDGRRVRVGQAATVQLRSVNLARRQLDFTLVDWGSGPAEMEAGADSAHPGFDRQRPAGGRSLQKRQSQRPTHPSGQKKKPQADGKKRGRGDRRRR